MSSIIIFPDLYRFSQQGREYCSLIAQPLMLSELKITFSDSYVLNIPRLIEIQIGKNTDKRIMRSMKDFNSNTYVYFKKLDLSLEDFMILPVFSQCDFKCLKCKIHHSKNSKQCCSLNGGIMIEKATLSKLVIPDSSEVEKTIENIRNEFILLHFPDILDTILL
jgi:hypothetical protein